MQDLVRLHKSLMAEVQDSILNKNALNLYQIFISYKERYVSNYEHVACNKKEKSQLFELNFRLWKYATTEVLIFVVI